MNDDQITNLSESLSNLSPSQWNEIKIIMEHLYHTIKKELTPEEISSSLKNIKDWI